MQSPYPVYAKWRAAGDFVFWTDYNMPMATTHEAVRAVLTSKTLGREVPEERRPAVRPGLEPFYDVEAHSMLELEPPRHTRLRGLVLRAFTRNRVLRLSPEISQIADGLIADFPGSSFDLLEHYAQKLPVIVIARLLGVPEDMAPQLLTWSNAMVTMYQARRTREDEDAAAKAAAEFAAFMRNQIELRRKAPSYDLLSQLIAAEEDGQRLSSDEMISTCILLLNAGHEATVHSIGNAVRHLAGRKDRAEALEPEQIERTVEECLRYDPPLHMFTRHAYEDTKILDFNVPAGTEVGCLLGSACRDDAIWPDGDKFDPFRAVHANTAFGAGIHFCVGAPLARLEMHIALPILFASCPNLRLADAPRVANLYHFHGLERLMVET